MDDGGCLENLLSVTPNFWKFRNHFRLECKFQGVSKTTGLETPKMPRKSLFVPKSLEKVENASEANGVENCSLRFHRSSAVPKRGHSKRRNTQMSAKECK